MAKPFCAKRQKDERVNQIEWRPLHKNQIQLHITYFTGWKKSCGTS